MSTTKETTKAEFTGLRAIFWPIHSFELKKVLPLALMMFAILVTYQAVRTIKDTLVINEAGGAATINYIKSFGTLPVGILFFLLYTKMATVFDKKKLFYASVTPFLIFFGIFGFFIYPNSEALQPSAATIDAFSKSYPVFEGVFRMFGCWTVSLFYIMAELFGSVVLSLLFWQFANQITRVSEAKRVYSFIAMFANTGLIFYGEFLVYFSRMAKSYENLHLGWQNSLYYLMAMVVGLCVIVIATYAWMQKNVLTDPRLYNPGEIAPKKKKAKLSFGESIKVVLTSKYLLLLTVLLISYGITINFCEVSYKDILGRVTGGNAGYLEFAGRATTISAFVNIACMFIGGIIVRRTSWCLSASTTPAIIGLTGILFFAAASANNLPFLAPIMTSISMAPLMVAAYMGALQGLLSKGTKYTLFDATKEMAYIPLDDTLKVQGKAAVDVIGGRAGKAAGGLIQLFLTSVFAVGVAKEMKMESIRPYIFVLFIILIVAWLYAIGALSKMFERANRENEERKKEIAESRVAENSDSKQPQPAT